MVQAIFSQSFQSFDEINFIVQRVIFWEQNCNTATVKQSLTIQYIVEIVHN